jgi:hypothetical protein
VPRNSDVTVTIPKTEKNKSSLVPRAQMDEFVAGLTEQQPLGFPVFSVSDCNSFHTSGYLWGLYAGKMASQNGLTDGAIAIANFDQHKDIDPPSDPTPGQKGVASDRWGKPLVWALNDLGYDACYVSACNPPGDQVDSYASTGNRERHYSKKGKIEDYESFWNDIEENIGKPIRYVFVTIDRDVIKSNFTQWGDGPIASPQELLKNMFEVLQPVFGLGSNYSGFLAKGTIQNTINKVLPKALLIGFDVTGLPEHSQIIKYGKPPDIASPQQYWVRQGDTIQKIAAEKDTSAGEIRQYLAKHHPELSDSVPPNDADLLPDDFKQINLPPPRASNASNVWRGVDKELQNYLEFAKKMFCRKKLPPDLRNVEWSKVGFFSGSVSYGECENGDEYKKFDCWDFMRCMSFRLGGFLKPPDWKFILRRGGGPAGLQGWKAFSLYVPGVSLGGMADKEAVKRLASPPRADLGGFASTAAVTDFKTAPGLGGPEEIVIYDLFNASGCFKQKLWKCLSCNKTFTDKAKPMKCDRCSGFELDKI